MTSLFPTVAEARRQSVELARQFYDDTRSAAVPDSPRHGVLLESYFLEWFRENMEPAKSEFVAPDADDTAVEKVIGNVNREIESGARRQTIRAVRNDPEALGWARYDPVQPTCAFCTILISRGISYNKDTGNKPSRTGLFDPRQGQFRSHEHCTCVCVPVFRGQEKSWPGYDQFREAESLWKELGTGGHKGKDALNYFARALREKRNGELEKSRLAA